MKQPASQFLQTEVLTYYQTSIKPELECLGFDSDCLNNLVIELAQEIDAELILSEQQQAIFLEQFADIAILLWSSELDSVESCKELLKTYLTNNS